MLVSLKIVICLEVWWGVWVTEKKTKFKSCHPLPPQPPLNGVLDYMLLVAVSWAQKDAFKLLNSKKYFLHTRFPGLQVESFTCYQLTPPWAAAFNDLQMLWFGSVENGHSCAPVAFNQRTVLNIAAIAGFWEGMWALTGHWYCADALVDEWQNQFLSSKVGTGWASAATASRPKNNWMEMALGSFLLGAETVPSQLEALHNSHNHCQGLGSALGSLPSSETDEYSWPVFTQLLLQLMGQTGSAGPAAVSPAQWAWDYSYHGVFDILFFLTLPVVVR